VSRSSTERRSSESKGNSKASVASWILAPLLQRKLLSGSTSIVAAATVAVPTNNRQYCHQQNDQRKRIFKSGDFEDYDKVDRPGYDFVKSIPIDQAIEEHYYLVKSLNNDKILVEKAMYYGPSVGHRYGNEMAIKEHVQKMEAKVNEEKYLALELLIGLWIREQGPINVFYVTEPNKVGTIFNHGFNKSMESLTKIGMGMFFAKDLEAVLHVAGVNAENAAYKRVILCEMFPGYFRKKCKVDHTGVLSPFLENVKASDPCNCDFHLMDFVNARGERKENVYYCVRDVFKAVLPLCEITISFK